jgi:VWFA-related protein
MIVRIFSASALAGALTLLTQGAFCQTGAGNGQAAPIYQTSAQSVLVDVTVTGKGGKPVTGLTGKDFELSEDGQLQDISYFQEHPEAVQPIQPLPQQPPDVFTNLRVEPLPGAVDVLLIDSLNTPLTDQTVVRQQVIQALQRLPRGARVAIFAMSVKLQFIQGFSTDPEVLLAALARSETNPQFSPLLKTSADATADAQTIHHMQELATSEGSASMQGSVTAMRRFLDERDASRTTQRIDITLQNLQELGRDLAGVPGRKNVIWFSGGFPIHIFPSAAGNSVGAGRADAETPIGQTATDASPQFFSQQLAETAELLHAAQVAVYPVDAGGLAPSSFYDVDAPPTNPGVPESQRESIAFSNEAAERNARNAAMDQIADGTGGKAYYNTNGLGAAMIDVILNGQHFYTLAYTPTDKNLNGGFRRLKVRVHDGSYKLMYRRGYYAISRQRVLTLAAKESPDPLQAYMAFGMPQFNQILYKVLIQPAKAGEGKPEQPGDLQSKQGTQASQVQQKPDALVSYDVDFAMPIDDLAFTVTLDGVHHGTVNLSLYAYDAEGAPVSRVARAITMNLQPADYARYQQIGLQFEESIRLPKTRLWLRTGVYDPASARVGTLEIPMSDVVAPKT